MKGIKPRRAGRQRREFTIDSSDDAFHSNSNLTVTAAPSPSPPATTASHADEKLTISGGTSSCQRATRGWRGLSVEVAGGKIDVTASVDGLNAAGGNDSSGFGGMWGGGDAFGANSDSMITISGGYLTVDSGARLGFKRRPDGHGGETM